MEIIVVIVARTLDLLALIVLADALLSWVQGPEQMPRRLLRTLTEPMYAPIHSILSPQATGGFDLSPLIVMITLSTLSRVLLGALT